MQFLNGDLVLYSAMFHLIANSKSSPEFEYLLVVLFHLTVFSCCIVVGSPGDWGILGWISVADSRLISHSRPRSGQAAVINHLDFKDIP